MESIALLSITADELQQLIAEAIAEALDRYQQPVPPPLPSPDDYLSRSEVSRMLHLSLATLHCLEKRGELIPVRISRRVLYRRSDIERALTDDVPGRKR